MRYCGILWFSHYTKMGFVESALLASVPYLLTGVNCNYDMPWEEFIEYAWQNEKNIFKYKLTVCFFVSQCLQICQQI